MFAASSDKKKLLETVGLHIVLNKLMLCDFMAQQIWMPFWEPYGTLFMEVRIINVGL